MSLRPLNMHYHGDSTLGSESRPVTGPTMAEHSCQLLCDHVQCRNGQKGAPKNPWHLFNQHNLMRTLLLHNQKREGKQVF